MKCGDCGSLLTAALTCRVQTSPVFFHHLLYSICMVPFSCSSRMARLIGSRHLEPFEVAIPYLQHIKILYFKLFFFGKIKVLGQEPRNCHRYTLY